jgi:hypothetical protein
LRIRSKGLGRIELLFDLSKVNLEQGDGGHLVITGKTLRPVVWDFRITISERDVLPIMKIAFRKPVRSLVATFLLSAFGLKEKETEEGGAVREDKF